MTSEAHVQRSFSYYENHSDEFLSVPLRSAYQFPSATEGCGPRRQLPAILHVSRSLSVVRDASGADATIPTHTGTPSSGNVSTYPEEAVRGFEFIGSFEGAVTGAPSGWLLQPCSSPGRNATQAASNMVLLETL